MFRHAPRHLPSSRRRFRAAFSATLSVLGVLGVVLLAPAQSASASASLPLVFTQVPGPLGTYAEQVTCASTTTCYLAGLESAGEENISISTNGGTTWSAGGALVSAPAGDEGAVACATATTCYVPLSDMQGETGPTAPSTIDVTTNGGSTWAAVPTTVPSGVGFFGPMSCPVVGTCVDYAYTTSLSAGVIIETTNGGSTWAALGTASVPADLSCPTTTTCLAVGLDTAVMTTDGGATWPLVSFPTGFTVEDAQCPSVAACFAIGAEETTGNTDILSTSNSGSSWTTVDATGNTDDDESDRIFCASATACTAEGAASDTLGGGSGAILWSTQDGGATWASDGETGGVYMACPSSTTCVGTDEQGHILVGTTGTSPLSGSVYTPLSPYRIADTRSGSGEPDAGKTLGAGGVVNIQVSGTGSGSDGVPTSGVTAVALNVTALGGAVGSFLTVWPQGTTRPVASNLNFAALQTVANLVIVPLGSTGQVSIYNQAGSTNVVVDVAGWFGPAAPASTAGQYVSAEYPTRIADTRTNSGEPDAGETLGARSTMTVTGFSEAPVSSASALVLNVTVTGTQDPGYLSVYSAAGSRPVTSNLNWAAGGTVAARVITPADSSDEVKIYNASVGSVNVIVDEVGWFTAAGDSGGGLFTPLSPARIADTRSGSGEPDAGDSPPPDSGGTSVPVSGVGGLPDTAVQAAVVNVTATNTAGAGYLSLANIALWEPGEGSLPWSDLNWRAGQTVANLSIGAVGFDGAVEVVNGSSKSAAVILDVSGWFS
jgi:hypothetical protein